MSLVDIILGTLFFALLFTTLNVVKSFMKKFKVESNPDETEMERSITGHEKPVKKVTITKKKALPVVAMATPRLELAFAEQTDWSEYDQPAYLRKNKGIEGAKAPEVKSAAPAVRKNASKQQHRMTPAQQLAEFKANSKGRAAEAQYEVI